MRSPFMLTHLRDDIYLVFHKRDQGRDDNGHTIHQQRGQLIAQRLAATGRHQHKRVLTVKHILHDGLLVSLERIEAEVFLQGFCKISFFGHIGFLLSIFLLISSLADGISPVASLHIHV